MRPSIENLKKCVSEVLDVDYNSFTETTHFSELEGWDSMTHMSLIAEIESLFCMELTGDQIASINSINQLFAVLNKEIV